MTTWQKPRLTGLKKLIEGLLLSAQREQQELLKTEERMKVLTDGLAGMQPEYNNTRTR